MQLMGSNITRTIASETFFNSPMHFDDLDDFETKILGVTHTDHQLSPELYKAVKTRLETHTTPDGINFLMPVRIDLLQVTDKQKHEPI